jgi:hypothetical protein
MDSDSLLIFKLISDAGLLVLIWLVQLVIYPSFRHYKDSELKQWHLIYTSRISLVVLPLMLSQLVLSCWLAIESNWDILFTINGLLVVLTWLSTFALFVPLHQKIDNQSQNLSVYVEKLISFNWIRTILWSIIVLMTLVEVLY